MEKATHKDTITMYQPVVKTTGGKYIAILSDDSIDRDGEIMSKEALMDVMNNDGYTAILFDHENKIMNQVGEWTNKRIETINGHTALVAEPKFYESNPNAKILKGMLDEGAKMGVSIGAIPKSFIEKTIEGVKRKVFTGLELLEASFVAIPSNRHGMVSAVAKMAKTLNEENTKMDEEIQKSFELEKTAHEELKLKFESSAEELSKAVVKAEEVEKAFETYKAETEKSLAEAVEKTLELEKSLEAKNAELEKLALEAKEAKEKALYKGNYEFANLEESEQDDVKKQLAEGKLPIFNK